MKLNKIKLKKNILIINKSFNFKASIVKFQF